MSPASGLSEGRQTISSLGGSTQIDRRGYSGSDMPNKGTDGFEDGGEFAESDSDAPPDLGIKPKSAKPSMKKADKNRKKYEAKHEREGQAAQACCGGDQGCNAFWYSLYDP